MIQIDLHTHTRLSRDAFTSMNQLKKFFRKNPSFVLAITDHDEIEGALQAQKLFSPNIIVGEEIKTCEGEIVGLFLKEFVEPGMTVEMTIEAIRSQDGLSMVPHPFKRHGNLDSPIKPEVLFEKKHLFDIIEVFNARNRTYGANEKALQFAASNRKPAAVGSDAHAIYELGATFAMLESWDGRKESLLSQLHSATLSCKPIHFFPRLCTRVMREIKKRVL